MTEEGILERRIELKHQLIVLTEAEIKVLEDKLQELREAKKEE